MISPFDKLPVLGGTLVKKRTLHNKTDIHIVLPYVMMSHRVEDK